MNLHQELLLRTHHLNPADVLGAMGYLPSDDTVLGQYRAVRKSSYLGLDTPYQDERVDERGFLEALCSCIGLNKVDYQPAITALAARFDEDRATYRHWLFADTDYVRQSTPIFVLAFTEHFRRLRFPIDFWRQPYAERVEAACQRAREHMQQSAGQLAIWGDIKRYHYFHAEGRSVIISPAGEVLNKQEGFVPSRATLSIEGSGENLGELFASSDDSG